MSPNFPLKHEGAANFFNTLERGIFFRLGNVGPRKEKKFVASIKTNFVAKPAGCTGEEPTLSLSRAPAFG